MSEGTWTIRPCPHRQASALAQELGLSEITASVLVRRGYGAPDEARAFLAGEQPLHDPSLLGDMKEAVARIRAAIAAGTRICVHGDYDVDGICATALALLILRELGEDAAWHLPSRFDEGYGVSGQTLERLAEDGCGLVLTVDCGITAVDEVTRARELGLDVIVTDHHRPAERLPECPLVATRPSTYPFPDLCGTGVVYKLGQALLGAESDTLRRHVDLVALATIADVVPLVGENRSLVIAGLRALARTQRPGLRALMKTARVDPAALDEASIGYRLAPRINAAGRLGHPATALELLLTEDPERAERLAFDLETLNRERQAVEDRILREALAQVESWPESRRARRGRPPGGGAAAGGARGRRAPPRPPPPARALRGAPPPGAVRSRQPAGDAARPGMRARRPRRRRRGQAPALPREARDRAGRGERDRLPARPAARPLPARRPLRRRVPARGEPLERHRGAAARRPVDLRHAPSLPGPRRELRALLARSPARRRARPRGAGRRRRRAETSPLGVGSVPRPAHGGAAGRRCVTARGVATPAVSEKPYELAYEASMRAIEDQARVFDGLQDPAGTVLAASAVVMSFSLRQSGLRPRTARRVTAPRVVRERSGWSVRVCCGVRYRDPSSTASPLQPERREDAAGDRSFRTR